MEQVKQEKKDSQFYEQKTISLAPSQNENLIEIEKEKRLALIVAWEESEKAKAQTRAYRELCSIEAWENDMTKTLQLDLKTMEDNLEVEKAEHSKRLKKKIPEIEKIAEAKREKIEKQKGQESTKIKQMSEKLCATPNAYPPNSKTCGCF